MAFTSRSAQIGFQKRRPAASEPQTASPIRNTMTYFFGRRINAALSTTGILVLLSPLVLAVMFVTQQSA
jgi:hypothetical protein